MGGEDRDKDVYNLMINGRKREFEFDVRQSALAAFFYSKRPGVESVMEEEAPFPMDEEKAARFLKKMPWKDIKHIKHHIVTFFKGRKNSVEELLEKMCSAD